MKRRLDVVGRIAPRDKIKEFGQMLSSAGMDLEPEYLLGALFVMSGLMSIIFAILIYQLPFTYVYLTSLTDMAVHVLRYIGISISTAEPIGGIIYVLLMFLLDAVISLILGPAVVFVSIYTIIILRIDNRRKKVEEVLPDFLMLAAANVRAGMTIDQAMWYAAKPEFGTLALEVELVARRVFAGEPFDNAIDLLAERLESKAVRRTVALIKQGMASGGEIANILERTGEESRNMQMIKKDIATSLLMYIIFIVFAAAVATPFLYAVSHQLLFNLEGIIAELPETNVSSITGGGSYGGVVGLATMFHFGDMPITADEFVLFAVFAIFVTSILASLVIGVIRQGSKVRGVRYIPFLMVVSYIIFIVSEAFLKEILGVMAM
ncbi:type II secretion system F family protein [Candidatus Micrarchaeota archaeon]|nr:type II secretion system F family protein [Candidatus Micrarchaeota archaeon]